VDLKHVKLSTKCRTVLPDGPSHKLLELLRLCRRLRHRTLVAVRCNKFANKVMDFLMHEGFRVLQLQGHASRIEAKKRLMMKDEYDVLVISDAKICAGMNLQFIEHVVLYSKTTKDMRQQIIGRAWRPGRVTRLHVHELQYSYESAVSPDRAGKQESVCRSDRI
jgi:superfamily II DNA/RNA helicase